MEILIENIVSQKRTNNCKLHLSDGRVFTISYDIIMQFKLSKNLQINQDLLNDVLNAQSIINAKQTAYNYVSYKPRTENEVRVKLQEKGYNSDVVETTIQFLVKFNYIDDYKIAKIISNSLVTRKNAGPLKIKMELKKKGINNYIIEDILRELDDEKDYYATALLAANKKMKMLAGKPTDKAKSSLYSYLQRQGFDFDIILHT